MDKNKQKTQVLSYTEINPRELQDLVHRIYLKYLQKDNFIEIEIADQMTSSSNFLMTAIKESYWTISDAYVTELEFWGAKLDHTSMPDYYSLESVSTEVDFDFPPLPIFSDSEETSGFHLEKRYEQNSSSLLDSLVRSEINEQSRVTKFSKFPIDDLLFVRLMKQCQRYITQKNQDPIVRAFYLNDKSDLFFYCKHD